MFLFGVSAHGDRIALASANWLAALWGGEAVSGTRGASGIGGRFSGGSSAPAAIGPCPHLGTAVITHKLALGFQSLALFKSLQAGRAHALSVLRLGVPRAVEVIGMRIALGGGLNYGFLYAIHDFIIPYMVRYALA